ncbi:hypothetical protein [Salipaludibacillus daqingensis]|uniref:hypothetical protein n=1 Tax=Salipaludibacillus daqingensis TaxID=3041001 RepID=UPI002475C8ED|nr:hypothetical protein [Salipaludibacillus daqingensis]
MTILMIFILIVIAYGGYMRYFPVKGIFESNFRSFENRDDILIVDMRTFQLAHNDPIKGSISMPLAYLKRHYHDIDEEEVYLIVSDKVELNISARFLKNHGFIICGYECKPEEITRQIESNQTVLQDVCKESQC